MRTTPENERESQPTRRARVGVMTTTGHMIRSDWADWTEEQLDEASRLFSDFEDLNNLSLEGRGSTSTTRTYFNPEYVVSVSIEVED